MCDIKGRIKKNIPFVSVQIESNQNKTVQQEKLQNPRTTNVSACGF
jgi:hypothetical protein